VTPGARTVIYGISEVRDEEDIVAVSVRHHLALGLDRVIVVDNGSRDGTPQVLDSLRHEPRFSWRTMNTDGHRQADIFTALAREARAEGAHWVLPFDADEFWDTGGEQLRDVLDAASTGLLRASTVNFVQARECTELRTETLSRIDHRALPHGGGPKLNAELVERGEIAYVEIDAPGKVVTRLSADVSIRHGNHNAVGAGEAERTRALRVLHAPLRSRAHLHHKAENGRRVAEVFDNPGVGWHSRRFARLEAGGKLDEEWAANSQRDGLLELPKGPKPVVRDETLVRAVERWL
jgi:glycosyltransferase involved in cell wall biosynthesis